MKLDLHTHCYEATWVSNPTVDTVREIVVAMKDRGLDGIAITEHNDKAYGYTVKEIVDHYFDGEILIIPGQEIDVGKVEIVELYLPGDVTFRFLAHPGFPYPGDFTRHMERNIHGIEFRNHLHNHQMDRQMIREAAEKYGLLLLTNSDAHSLKNIGQYYNEIDIEVLCTRVR